MNRWRLAALLAAAALSAGCASGDLCRPPAPLSADVLAFGAPMTACRIRCCRASIGSGDLLPDELPRVVADSEESLATAEELDRQQRDSCVDLYYRSALQTARVLELVSSADPLWRTAWQTHHQALEGLIQAGQRHGRLDPRRYLQVNDGGVRIVPISYFGFAWRPADFSQLASAARFESDEITNRYANCGLGLSLVGVRIADCPNEVFFRHRQPFAVTAVLRPRSAGAAGADPEASAGGEADSVLELYNPNVYRAIRWSGSNVRLSRDLTAPFAAVVGEAPRQYLRGFTAPGDTSVKPQLIMLEPYQKGKIPVVFIHGLYSDPITWVDTINDLSSQGDIYQHYQFWVFRYPTGGEVLESAAELRDKLRLAREFFAPQHDDRALDEMVLVGHSLGGLMAKMQVVTSHDILWNEVANQPFEAVQAPPELQARLARDLFFEPLPFVTRVVFIGTPHQGSGIARRLAGRVGSSLVRFGAQEDAQYRDLMDANRDVFKPAVRRSRPTSVDLLEPTSPFLAALRKMPIQPSVRMHSIIGTGGDSPFEESDGVVTVTSAHHPCVRSELFVSAKHEKLHRDPASIADLTRILRIHASEGASAAAGAANVIAR